MSPPLENGSTHQRTDNSTGHFLAAIRSSIHRDCGRKNERDGPVPGTAPPCPMTDLRSSILDLRRGWGLGSVAFREELLAQVSEREGWHYGVELMESAEAKAERLLGAELSDLGWTEADLAGRRKGGRVK